MNKNKFVLLHIIESLDFGGMENGIINTLNMLDKERYFPVICCLKKSGNFEKRINDKNIPVIAFDKEDGFKPILFLKLVRIMLKYKVDIVHAHGWGTLLYSFIAAKISRVPVIINGEHGAFHLEKKTRRITYRGMIKSCDKVLTVAEALRGWLISELKILPEKILTISNGVDSSKFCVDKKLEDKRRKLGISKDDVVLGSVGRLAPVKNFPLLIRATSVLKEEFPSIKCLIVGNGQCMEEFKSLVRKLNIEKEVIFLGERSDIEDIIPLMDIFYLTPDIGEGMSNAILEAMSCGKPVIATDIGGTKEVVLDNHNGFLIKKGDLEGLLKGTRKLLLNPELKREFGKHSREFVLKHHSMDRMVKMYEGTYKECLVGKGLWR